VLTVPKYLVITVAIYSALLTLAMTVIGRRMIHVIVGKNAAEAQFRSVASNLRERGAVELAVADGPSRHRLPSAAFDTVIGRWRDLCIQCMRTTLVPPVIAWVLCAPKYLVGTMAWRGGPGIGRLCDGAGGTQLAGRQLSRPSRVPLVGEPRCRAALGAGRVRPRWRVP
jgi:hypothetical protein